MRKTLVIFIIFLLNVCYIHAQEYETITLLEIINNNDKYVNKSITLKLKFRNLDPIFKKITFYDNENHDIVFDIAGLINTKQFQKERLNLHEGLEYIVEFTVKEVIAENAYITGDLISFKPVLLSNLPEGKQKK